MVCDDSTRLVALVLRAGLPTMPVSTVVIEREGDGDFKAQLVRDKRCSWCRKTQ